MWSLVGAGNREGMMVYNVVEYCVLDDCHCQHKAGVIVATSVDLAEAKRIASQPSPGYEAKIVQVVSLD